MNTLLKYSLFILVAGFLVFSILIFQQGAFTNKYFNEPTNITVSVPKKKYEKPFLPCPEPKSKIILPEIKKEKAGKRRKNRKVKRKVNLQDIPKLLRKFEQSPLEVSDDLINAFSKYFKSSNSSDRFVNQMQKKILRTTINEVESLESSAYCNTYPYKPPLHGGIYKACKFKNICLTSGGKWKLFLSKEKALRLVDQLTSENSQSSIFENGVLKTFLYNDKRPLICHDRWDWLCFKPIIENEKTLLALEENNVKVSNTTSIKLSKKFTWYTDSVVAMERAWIPMNFGHALLEDLIPSFTMMQSLSFEPMRPLFLNDLRNIPDHGTSIHQKKAVETHGLQTVERKSAEWASLVTTGKALSMCGATVKTHPCPDSMIEEQKDDPESLQACFSSLAFGYHSKMLFDGLTDRDPSIYSFKENIIKKWNLKKLKESYKPMFKEEGTVLIGIQKKPTGTLNLDLMTNVDELVEFMKENSELLEKKFCNKVQVVSVELEKMNIVQQILFFLFEIDVYVSTQGAASYYSFLMKEDSTLIYAPSCSRRNVCSDKNIMFHKIFAHLKVASMASYNVNMLECVNRETNAPKISYTKDEVLGECILKVDKHILLEQILNVV